MGTTRLFLHTTPPSAERILRLGFSNEVDRNAAGSDYSGVRLTDNPAGVTRAGADTLLAVDLNLGLDQLDQFDWRIVGGMHREWLIPADIVNAHIVALVIAYGDEQDRGRSS